MSFIALVILSPVLLVTAFFISIESKGPVLFKQRRIGINNTEFIIYKFRSMRISTPEVATDKLADSQSYITRVGFYIRKYSIDELPQLINIFLGDMSIVGPRPALYNQYDLRELRNQLGISKIKPGLTGWAQINGRNEIPLQQKIELDLYYLKNQSFWLDLYIIYRTVFSIYAGDGVTKKSKQHAG
jgi:O-antigen biosynthesis protein WbqP